MAGNSVEYIIKLLADDSPLKKQLKSNEKDISNLNAHERAEVKSTFQVKMRHIKDLAKANKSNPSNTKITENLENEAKDLMDAFKAMKELDPTAEWTKNGKAFAQTFSEMHKQFSELAKIIEPLKGLVEGLGDSFSNLGFNVTPTADMSGVQKQVEATADGIARVSGNFVVVGNKASVAATKTNHALQKLEEKLTAINDLSKRVNINDIKFRTHHDLALEFTTMGDALEDTIWKINELKSSLNNMSPSDKGYGKTVQDLSDTYVQQSELVYKMQLINQKYLQTYPGNISLFEGMEINPDQLVHQSKTAIKTYINEMRAMLDSISDKTSSTQDGINIPIKMPTKDQLIKVVNKYISEINDSEAIHSIKIDVDDSANVIEDKTRRKYKDNPEDDDANTTKLVEKTENRFEAVREAIDKKQGAILEQTKTWRKDMLDQLKFKNGDFEFNFGGDLFQSLQDYLNEQGNELKFVIDQETIKEQLKTVIENSGLTVGGLGGTSTAVVDASAIAQAVRAGMESAITGQPLPSFDVSSETDTLTEVAESVEDIVNSTDKYVKTITEKTINSERVIEALRAFAQASTQKGAGRQNVAKWLTSNGIDIDAINNGASDDAVRKMLNEALMTKDRFGYAKGSLLADSLSDLKQFGITGGKQEADVRNVTQEIVEMLSRMGINQEYWQESQRRYQSYESYENAAKYGRPIATLSKVRKPLYANSMKNFADGGYKRLTDSKYIGNLDSLISFMDSLQSEHLSKADQEIELAQQKALKLKKEFTDLDSEAEVSKKRLDELTAEYKRLSETPDDKLTQKDIANRAKVKKELDTATKQYTWNRRDSKDKKNEYLRLVSYTDKEGKKHTGLIEQMTQRRNAQGSVYDEAKNQVTSFKNSILGLGENPAKEAIDALEQTARGFFEQSGKMMQKMFGHYGDMDTFQGRVTLQNGRTVDINSPYDFLGIKDDEVANVDIYRDILMKKWEKSNSIKKGIPQDFDRPNYYINRPKPPIDIENERIESQDFVPIDAAKTSDLTHAISATEYRIQQLSEENKNAAQEVKKLSSEIQAKEQEVQRLSEAVNALSEEEKQSLTKEAEKAQKTLSDKQNKQSIEEQNIRDIDAKIYSAESAIQALQTPVSSEEFDTKYNDLDRRIYQLTQNQAGFEESKASAYDAYEQALLNHEAAKKAYDDYVEKLVNEALQEASKSGEIKRLAEERGISSLEAMSIKREALKKKISIGDTTPDSLQQMIEDVKERVLEEELSKHGISLQALRESNDPNAVHNALNQITGGQVSKFFNKQNNAVEEFRRSKEYQDIINKATTQRETLHSLSSAETNSNFEMLRSKDVYGRIVGQVDSNNKLIEQLKQERDSLTIEAMQLERDAALQQKQTALEELRHQRKLADNRLKRAQKTEQSSADMLANNVVLQHMEVEKELKALRLRQSQISNRTEETSATISAEQKAKKRLELQSEYNQLTVQERKLRGEIEQLEDGDAKSAKNAELETTIATLSELEKKIIALGGTVTRVAQQEYTEEQKKSDALHQAVEIQNKLIEAKAQQRAYDSEIRQIEKLEENVRHGGLTSTIGRQYENSFKSSARKDFKDSEYYHDARNQKKETLNQELDKFASEQAQDIIAQIEKKKDDIRNQVIQKALGKKNIDLSAIRKTAIDEYVKTDGYKKVVADASATRTSRQADADNTFNREVNEYINNLVATEMTKRVSASDIDKRAKDQNISVEDARKAIEQEIRRDVEQQYKEEIRQFRGQANIRKQAAYTSAKIEEQTSRSNARQSVGQSAVDKEIDKIAKEKASEIKRKQEAAVKAFEESDQYTQMHEGALNNVKQKQRELWDALDDEMKKMVDEYIAAIKADKGKAKITDDRFRSVFNNFIANSQYSLSGQGEVDLKQYILDELAKQKAIAKGESDKGGKEKQEYIKGLPQLIADLEKSLAEALAYGGFERGELADRDLLQEIIDKTVKLKSDEQDLVNKEQELSTAITELQDAQKQNKDTKPYKARVKELKAEIQEKEKLIDKEESEIENAKEQIALRAEEKAASSQSLSKRLADTEQRLATSKENLANVKKEITDLEKIAKETETKHGKDSPEAERARLNLLYKQRAQRTLERNISRDEKRVQRWSGKVITTDATTETSGVSASTRGGIFDGIISEMKAIASSMSGTIDVDNSDIATETTLRAIFEMLSGGGEASAALDAEKVRSKAEREARRKEEQARVIVESKQKKIEHSAESNSSGQSKSAKAKDKLSTEGQEYFKAITKAGSEYANTLKELDKQGVLSEMGKQVQKLNGMTKGTPEYLEEQYKLAHTVFAYRSKLEAEGITSHTRKKDGKKYLDNTAVVGRDEVKALGDVKSLMISKVKDVADSLIKLGYGAKLSGNKKKSDDLNSLDTKTLTDRFRYLNDITRTSEEEAEYDKVLQLLTERGVYKGSQQVLVKPEMEPGALAEEVDDNVDETKPTAKVEPTVDSDAYKKAVETVRGAIGDFDMRSSKTAKVEKYASLGPEVGEAYDIISQNLETATKAEKALVDRFEKLRVVAMPNQSTETTADLNSLDDDTLTQRFIELQRLLDTNAITESQAVEFRKVVELIVERGLNSEEDDEELVEEGTDEDRQAILDTINNIGEKVIADKVEESAPQVDSGQVVEKELASQGGIIGIMRTELAQDSTLKQVLSALGEIAKKNAMAGAGKQNSAQDLLEQFRRMLESDAWESRERVAYLDLTTGSMSNSITGDDRSISADRLNILRTAYKDIMDLNAQVHTHANEEDPYFSKDDLNLFASDFADGITKQILLSKNNMTVLDMTDVKDINGLLDALAKTEQNFEALATTADKFGAKYVSRAFSDITPQGLVKLLGIKGIESKYTETETRESARKGVLAEDAKEAADILQESTGRAIKKTVERVGLELETLTEKTDAKGNKTWSSQISNKFGKAMQTTNKEIESHKLDEQFGVGTKASVALKEYRDTYKQLTDYVNQFNNSTSDTEKAGLQKQINDLIPVFNKAEKELIDLIARKEQFLRVGEKLGDVLNQDSIGKGSLEAIATREFFGDGLTAGQNIATAGTQSTKNGRQLLVDVLDHGTISRYGIEVDEVTGQVRKLTLAEGDLANAFQNVNRAMKQDKAVQASVAIGEDATQMQQFLNTVSSPAWDTYKTSLQEMQDYTAGLWNTMKAGESVSQEELDYLMALSERVITLGKNVQKTSIDFKNFWTQNPDNVFGIDKISYDPDNKDARVREELEKRARVYANASNTEYNFSSFDNDTLQFTLTDAEGKISKVTYQWNELYNQIAMVSDKSTSALDPMVAKINRYDEAIQQAVKDGYLMYEDSNFNAFYEATDGIRFLVGGIEQGYETFDTVKDKLYELRQEALKYGEQAKKTIAQNKRLFAGTGAKKQAENQYNKIFGTAQAGGLGFDLEATDNPEILTQYINAYNRLNTDYQKYVDNHSLNNPKIQQQIQQQATQVQLLGRRFLSSITQAEKLKGLVEQSGTFRDRRSGMDRDLGGTIGVSAEEVKNLETKMRDFVENGLGQANIEGVKFDAVNQRLTYSFRTSQRSVADMVVQYNEATKALYAYQKQERESLTGLPGFMNSMKAKMKSILQYTASITSIYRVWGELRRGVQYIREIDSALTELKKVTDETEKTYDRFLKTAAKTADKVGSTIKEVVSSTADWARLGYSLEDAAHLAESTSVLLNVSEFQSIDEATSALTSTLQAFGYTANQSMEVVDVMNEIGNNFAISSDGIATALQDSASSLMAANNSYEEAVALIASANRVVQDPNSVGAALRTISLRLRGTSATELAEAGEDTDGAITSKSKLRSKIKGLSGVDILTDSGAYKSTYEILLDISKVWKDMSDINQAALLEILAGKTRSNTAAAILSNTKDLKAAYEQALEAEGSALEENEKYLDSIQGRIDLFNNSVQTMWSNTLDSSVVKGIVDIGTGLIKIVDNLGLVKTLVFAIGTYLIQKNFKGDLFGGLFPQKDKEYDALENTLTSLQNKRQSLIDDLQNSQAYEDFLGKRMAAGYDDAARAIDKVHIKNEQLKGQIQQLDTEIVNTKTQMDVLGTSGLTVGQRIKAGFSKAKTAVAQFGKELIKSMAWSMAITAVLESLTIIGGWFGDFLSALKPDTFEDLQEALEQTESELSNVESEIRSLSSELDDANDRIEELTSQDSLSYVEQEELAKLKSATAELEAQIALKRTLQESLQANVNGQAIEANEAYLNTSFMSDQTRTERQEEWGENGEEIGKVIGTGIGITFGAKAMAALGAKLGTAIAPGIGTAIGVAAGAIIGGVIGKFTGEGLAGVSYDSEQSVGEAMDNMVAERNRLKAEQDEALAEKDVEAYNEATEALRTYDNQMAKHISQIQENYNAMDWETAADEEKQKMIDYADWLSKYSISMGTAGAKSAAIERIFGVEADDKLKSIKDQFINTAKAGKDISRQDLADAFGEAFVNRIYDAGLSLTDLVSYFEATGEAAKEAEETIDNYDAVQSINGVTDAVSSLKESVVEFDEQGLVSAKTLTELNEIFKDTDGWTEFVNAASTGTKTLEEFEELAGKLAENKIDAIFKNGNYSAEDYLTYINQLRSLGVQNAIEYVDDKILEGAFQEVANSIDNGEISDEEIQAIVDKYGIEREEIDKNIDKLKELAEAEQNYQDAATAQGDFGTWKNNFDLAEEKTEDMLNPDNWWVDGGLYHYTASDGSLILKTKEEYEALVAEYENAQAEYQKLMKEAIEKGWATGTTNEDGIITDFQITVDDEKLQKDVDNLKTKVDGIKGEIETELTADIQLKIDFINASEEVDKIQSVYDTLMDAATEYNKNGYFSVDTLQSLLALEPKYLTMLINEQGQLEFNKQAVLNVAQARLFDMTQKQIDSIITNASNAAKDGEISKLEELTSTLYEAADAQNAFNISQMATLKQNLANPELGLSETEQEGYYNKVQAQIDAAVAAYNKTVSNLPKALSGGSAASGDPDENAALEALQERYERQIKNLDNQQTYIQNEIDRLEAEDKAVSKSYYEQQIGLEEKKLSLYEQERQALLKLNMTDEVADALWEVEHAIQESTMRMVEFRQSIIDLYKTAFDDIVGAYDNKDSFLSDQQEYIEKYRELLELQKNPESASGYQEQIQLEKDKMQDNIAELAVLESALADAMTYGGLERGSEEWIEMQEQIRATEAAILDNKIAIEQYKEELKNIPVEAFNSVRDAFSFQDDILTSQQDYIQGYADHLEAIGVDVPQELYDELIAIEQDKRANTLANLVNARQGFDDIQAQGFTAADEEWQDAYNQLVELEKKIQDSDTAIAEWQKTIRELDFEKFERFISRLDDIDSEIDHLRGLFDDEDVAFEDGTWTKEGITSLGLLYHQMQLNQEKSQEYAQEIEELNEEYDKGSMSEQEYYEQLQELKDGQWDAIESYEDAKDAIIDMEEARIDMIEEGINKEIEAYEELIDLKREELDAERDLYDFKKDTEEQTKNIAELQRKIASLSGSDDASDIATRRQLEAELRDAQAGLDDTYYNHAMDSQSDALDNEVEAYKKGKDNYLEMLRDTLEDTKAIIAEKIQEVLSNADTVLNTIDTTAGEHGVTLSTSLKKPWTDAATAASAFKASLDETLPLMTNEDGVITVFNSQAKALLEGVFNAGGTAAGNFKTAVDTQLALIKTAVETSSSELTSKIQFPWTDTTKEDGPLATFSQDAKDAIDGAVTQAKTNAEAMKSYLSSPWTNATTAVNTFSTTVAKVLNDNLAKVKQNVKDINAEGAKVNYPSYVGNDGNPGSGYPPAGFTTGDTDADGKTMHQEGTLGQAFIVGEQRDLDKNLVTLDGEKYYKRVVTNRDGVKTTYYYKASEAEKRKYVKGEPLSFGFPKGTGVYKYYAKGTLGTKQDELAITDESWIGEEITLAAGKNGQLQYLKKGSAVMPADISANLVEWGKINPNMMQVGGGANINLISNAVNKPEFSLDIENFLRCDNVSQDTMPELKRFVNEQMNNLMKQMNYSIKRYK